MSHRKGKQNERDETVTLIHIDGLFTNPWKCFTVSLLGAGDVNFYLVLYVAKTDRLMKTKVMTFHS